MKLYNKENIKDLNDKIKNEHKVIASVIKDIRANGYDEALKEIEQGNLHKAYNIIYINKKMEEEKNGK